MRDYWKFKAKFLEMYGNVCACCHEANPKFLTLDHVQNDGAKDRTQIIMRERMIVIRRGTMSFLRDATSRFQPEKYRILCYNCNMGRSRNGGVCPHRQEHPDMRAYRRIAMGQVIPMKELKKLWG